MGNLIQDLASAFEHFDELLDPEPFERTARPLHFNNLPDLVQTEFRGPIFIPLQPMHEIG